MDDARANVDLSSLPSSLDERRLRALLTIGRSVVSMLDLEAVLSEVLMAARELTGARYAAVGVLASDRRSLERFVTSGIEAEERERIGDPPHGRGILGLLITDPRPLRLADVGAHPQSYGFPLDHPAMSTFLGVPVVIQGQAWGNLYLTEKAGGEEFDDDDESAICVLAEWAATAIENARQYQDQLERRDSLERVVRALETTTEIARAVGGETRLDRVLELIVKRGRALVEARTMVLLLHAGDELVVRAAAGTLGADLVGRRVPVEGSQTGGVLRSRQSRRLTDIQSTLRYGLADDLAVSTGLLVPLIFHGRALGVLCAFDRLRAGPGFSAEDERLMDAFATSAATAVATAQNFAQLALRRSIEAAEAERSRWARDLHDDTLQELAALKIALTSARRRQQPERVDEVLGNAVVQLDATIRDLRAIVTDLRPAALDVLGVLAALEAMAERMQSRSNLAIELSVDLAFEAGRQSTRLAPEIELTLYRLVQEAVTNAARHSGGTAIQVQISEDPDMVVGAIIDDGHGFEPGDASAGFGLIGMRERVALVDGTLDVRSDPAGTRVDFTLPARRSDLAEAAGYAGDS